MITLSAGIKLFNNILHMTSRLTLDLVNLSTFYCLGVNLQSQGATGLSSSVPSSCILGLANSSTRRRGTSLQAKGSSTGGAGGKRPGAGRPKKVPVTEPAGDYYRVSPNPSDPGIKIPKSAITIPGWLNEYLSEHPILGGLRKALSDHFHTLSVTDRYCCLQWLTLHRWILTPENFNANGLIHLDGYLLTSNLDDRHIINNQLFGAVQTVNSRPGTGTFEPNPDLPTPKGSKILWVQDVSSTHADFKLMESVIAERKALDDSVRLIDTAVAKSYMADREPIRTIRVRRSARSRSKKAKGSNTNSNNPGDKGGSDS